MAKSIWRRNDLIYMPRKKKEKKNGDEPTPPTGQGDIFALVDIDANFIHGIGANYFIGFNSFALGSGTIYNRFAYERSGLSGFDVMYWPDSYTVSDIESMIWKRRLPGNGMLLFIPPTGSDLYLASYYGEEIFTLQMNNVTATYTLGGVDYTYLCQKFPRGTATNLDSALQACSGYGTGGRVLLIRGYTPADMQALNDTSLLSIANTIMKSYATSQRVSTVVRV